LYYYGARYLDPTGAMWLSVDPMWEKYAGMSPYNYCAGNPVKMVDPDGRDVKRTDTLFLKMFSPKIEGNIPTICQPIDGCSSLLRDTYDPLNPPRSPNKGLITDYKYRCVSDGGCTPCSFDIAFEYLGVAYDHEKCQYDSQTNGFEARINDYFKEIASGVPVIQTFVKSKDYDRMIEENKDSKTVFIGTFRQTNFDGVDNKEDHTMPIDDIVKDEKSGNLIFKCVDPKNGKIRSVRQDQAKCIFKYQVRDLNQYQNHE